MPVAKKVASLLLDGEEKYNPLALLNAIRLAGTQIAVAQAERDLWRLLYAEVQKSEALQHRVLANFIRFFLKEIKREMRYNDLLHYLEALPTLFQVNSRRLGYAEVSNMCEDFFYRLDDLKAMENIIRLALLLEVVMMDGESVKVCKSLINRCVAVRLKRQNITLFPTRKQTTLPWLQAQRQAFARELQEFMIYGK